VPEARTRDAFFKLYVRPFLDERASRIVESVVGVAERLGVTPAAVAVSWVTTRPAVSSAVVGASSAAQLRETLDGASLTLPTDTIQLLSSVSAPYIGAPETSWAVPE
jgi:aryl-alcohol dehydrogenase-like predicted oxidoreductase